MKDAVLACSDIMTQIDFIITKQRELTELFEMNVRMLDFVVLGTDHALNMYSL